MSFADSRQAAARTALDVENLHHRDLLRELLMVTLVEVDADRTQANTSSKARLQQIDKEIEAWRASADLSDVQLLQQLQAYLEERSRLATSLQQQELGVIPMTTILELDAPKHGQSVGPLLSHLIRLQVHPWDERGLSSVKAWPLDKEFSWWELFRESPDRKGYIWSKPKGVDLTDADFGRAAEKMLSEDILRSLADVVFHKSYFSLEASGLAMPVPLPAA